MFVELGSATDSERYEHAFPIIRPLLEGVHEPSTDPLTAEGFEHEEFIDPSRYAARVERGMAVPGHVAD
jgi:hypothetical protein